MNNWKKSLDNYLTSGPPEDGFTEYYESVIESFTNDFYNENEEFIEEYNGILNKWINKIYFHKNIYPIEAAKLIERTFNRYKIKSDIITSKSLLQQLEDSLTNITDKELKKQLDELSEIGCDIPIYINLNNEKIMKESKKDLVDAILYYAEKYNSRKNYVALMESYPGLGRVIEIIVYDMFCNKLNISELKDDDLKYYSIILNYSLEIKQNGFVTFDDTK